METKTKEEMNNSLIHEIKTTPWWDSLKKYMKEELQERYNTDNAKDWETTKEYQKMKNHSLYEKVNEFL